jgi:HPt (histidine-containing phosphotransfer) domain-containing protein
LPVDFVEVMERLGGDEELLRELVELYADDEDRLLGEMDAALAAGDATALRKAAHTLKGAVSNFCARRAHAASQALEFCGRDGRLEDAPALLDALRSELAQVRSALAGRLA